jgi:hypothetical protein
MNKLNALKEKSRRLRGLAEKGKNTRH